MQHAIITPGCWKDDRVEKGVKEEEKNGQIKKFRHVSLQKMQEQIMLTRLDWTA